LAFSFPKFFFEVYGSPQDMHFQVGMQCPAVPEPSADIGKMPGRIAQVFGHGFGRDKGIQHKIEKRKHSEPPDYFLNDYRYKIKLIFSCLAGNFLLNYWKKGVKMDDFADLLERCLIEVIGEILKAKRMKNKDFAVKLWPGRTLTASVSRWNVIKGYSHKTGVPQRLIFSDTQRMAEVLEIELPYLILRAKDRAMKKMEENQVLTPQKTK
jgi:hypothetical protein